jgi:peptide/nickel transport system permease protein
LSDGRQYVTFAWWLAVWPGVAIMLTVLSVNTIGDWLRVRFDPKMRQL